MHASCVAQRPLLQSTILSGLLSLLAACATQPLPAPAACDPGDQARTRDTLYFGRNRPDGGSVDDAQWQLFLDEVITPRFPDGLTVMHAAGQWRGASGKIEREPSEVVTVLHAGDAAAQRAVAEIAAEYKRRFRQEAVLRERSMACARF